MAKNKSSQSASSGKSAQSNQGGKVDNILYDIVTVLHQKSKGLEAYDKYEKDLQGQDEIREIFDEIRTDDERAVQQLRDCLREYLAGSEGEIAESEEEDAA